MFRENDDNSSINSELSSSSSSIDSKKMLMGIMNLNDSENDYDDSSIDNRKYNKTKENK